MTDILHHVVINGPPSAVFSALTTNDGIRQWWTEESSIVPKLGSVAKFGFSEFGLTLCMRIDECVPFQRLSWTCISGSEEWQDSTLTFEIMQNGEHCTTLIFQQSGFKLTNARITDRNKYWSAAFVRLKACSEGSPIGPLHRNRCANLSVKQKE